MQWIRSWLNVTAVLAAAGPGTVAAQIDYRNLDDGRPSRVADAYPIERFAFELSLPNRASWNGRFALELAPELAYGVARSAAIGVRTSITAVGRETGAGVPNSWGGAWAMANLRRETPGAPAISVRIDWEAPFDRGGLSQSSVALTALATRSMGPSRLHLNAGWRVAAPNDPALRSDGEWWLGLAADHTLWRTSTLLIADLSVERASIPLGTSWEAGVGLRRQITPTLVLSAGVSRGSRADEGETRVTIGLSHAFGIAGLIPRRKR